MRHIVSVLTWTSLYLAAVSGIARGQPSGSIVGWGSGQCNVPPPNEDFVGIAAGANVLIPPGLNVTATVSRGRS